MCVGLCVFVWSKSLTTTSRARWQADGNKMDGVDSNDEFIVPPESTEDENIHGNYEAWDQNEYLTFHIPFSFSLSLFLSFSLSLGPLFSLCAAGYMRVIHHCIFTMKLLTERRMRSFIGYILQGWTKQESPISVNKLS